MSERPYTPAPSRDDVFGEVVLGTCVMRAKVSFDTPAYKEKVRGGRNLSISLVVNREDAPAVFAAIQGLTTRTLRLELYAPESRDMDFEEFMDAELGEADDNGPLVVVTDGD